MEPTVRDVWDAEASRFDEEADHGLLDPAVRSAWADLLQQYVPRGSTILDLGCGTGSLSVLLAELGHSVTGVDLSPRMVEVARAKAARHGVDVPFMVGDAAVPPVTSRYDVVLARHVVWALPDPSAALGRWRSLLRDGGRFVLIEGLWGTGAGLSAAALQALVEPTLKQIEVRDLPDPALWGRAIDDERYILAAHG
jgi:SAM-dependent methyltransferase